MEAFAENFFDDDVESVCAEVAGVGMGIDGAVGVEWSQNLRGRWTGGTYYCEETNSARAQTVTDTDTDTQRERERERDAAATLKHHKLPGFRCRGKRKFSNLREIITRN